MAITNSLIFLWIVLLGDKNAVLAYCWVIVDPPSPFNEPDLRLLIIARPIPVTLNALFE